MSHVSDSLSRAGNGIVLQHANQISLNKGIASLLIVALSSSFMSRASVSALATVHASLKIRNG